MTDAALEAAARAIAGERFARRNPHRIAEAKDWVADAFDFDDAQAAITAYLAAREAEGFVMVPVEPNSAMIEAARTMQMPAEYNSPERFALALIANTYRAMITARPQNREA